METYQVFALIGTVGFSILSIILNSIYREMKRLERGVEKADENAEKVSVETRATAREIFQKIEGISTRVGILEKDFWSLRAVHDQIHRGRDES